ncbi:secretory carrier-associated membrane protein 3-like [Cryptomeria japonica]|uniref:secretory carrier-associated membrane protein 3-like n=1 Tax=Cryptomeria japonica TaxID=3369 RepID=UPI0027DAA6C5|nr:secretory carrier-associated membrane protein 3-like [Cryptomeria japonica]
MGLALYEDWELENIKMQMIIDWQKKVIEQKDEEIAPLKDKLITYPGYIPIENGAFTVVSAEYEPLSAGENAELRKKEQELKRREEIVARSGVVIQEENWPPFFPIIHNDIAREIPPHAQRLMYVTFESWLGMVLYLTWN